MVDGDDDVTGCVYSSPDDDSVHPAHVRPRVRADRAELDADEPRDRGRVVADRMAFAAVRSTGVGS